MGSSKIQEYNLDPNNGFAKEDTAQEILSQMGQGVTANVVKSIQRGTITITMAKNTATATINEVDTEKAVLIHLGNSLQGAQSAAHLVLTNGTTITATKDDTSDQCTVAYEVVEFY